MSCSPQGIDSIIADVVRRKGPLLKPNRDGGSTRKADADDASTYQRVWEAFNAYVTSTLSKRRTLNVANFCKIGWREEPTRCRPHFQFSENFRRSYGIEMRAQSANQTTQDDCWTQVEELSYSKVALHYTRNLTKDHVFSGFRSIFQQLGERISHGQPVCLELDVGRLICGKERDVRFEFSSEAYALAGLDAPEETQRRDDSALSVKKFLKGSASSAAREGISVHFSEELSASQCKAVDEKHSAPTAAALAFQRHLEDLKAEAAAAVADKLHWDAHLKTCVEDEKRDAELRKAMVKDNAEQLRMQIQEREDKKRLGREHSIQQASMHGFPDFWGSVQPEIAEEYIRERSQFIKTDLEKQMREKRERHENEFRHERHLEAIHIETAKKELEASRRRAKEQREKERAGLREAWSEEEKMRSARRAILQHSSAPSSKSEGTEALNELLGEGTLGQPKAALDAAAVGVAGSRAPRPATGESLTRPVTGSVRRMPIGAAASLAVYKKNKASKSSGSQSARQ